MGGNCVNPLARYPDTMLNLTGLSLCFCNMFHPGSEEECKLSFQNKFNCRIAKSVASAARHSCYPPMGGCTEKMPLQYYLDIAFNARSGEGNKVPSSIFTR